MNNVINPAIKLIFLRDNKLLNEKDISIYNIYNKKIK
jgi:hypothetical protein